MIKIIRLLYTNSNPIKLHTVGVGGGGGEICPII